MDRIKNETMIKSFRRLFYRIFQVHEWYSIGLFSYDKADEMIRENDFKPVEEHWLIAPDEDRNIMYGYVWLGKKRRILI